MTTTLRTVPRRLTAPLIALFVAALVVLVPQVCRVLVRILRVRGVG